MKSYYANILGEWVDVTYSTQIIGPLPDDKPSAAGQFFGDFVKIFTDDGCHIVHKSMIQVFDDERP